MGGKGIVYISEGKEIKLRLCTWSNFYY